MSLNNMSLKKSNREQKITYKEMKTKDTNSLCIYLIKYKGNIFNVYEELLQINKERKIQ